MLSSKRAAACCSCGYARHGHARYCKIGNARYDARCVPRSSESSSGPSGQVFANSTSVIHGPSQVLGLWPSQVLDPPLPVGLAGVHGPLHSSLSGTCQLILDYIPLVALALSPLALRVTKLDLQRESRSRSCFRLRGGKNCN